MKVTKTERIIVETIYKCEGCGFRWDSKFHTEVCPTHGEFCTHCIVDKNALTYPFVICPHCNPPMKDLFADLYHNKDPFMFRCDKNNLRKPWVVLDDKSEGHRDGDWIGQYGGNSYDI